jgi:hypothetical protein
MIKRGRCGVQIWVEKSCEILSFIWIEKKIKILVSEMEKIWIKKKSQNLGSLWVGLNVGVYRLK